MKYKLAAILLLFMAANTPLSAQKVGLVLSGGGAKGLYHIGVIKALENNGIPIDYVAGTSMGAIIAGMYAAGYSPDEMAEICRSGQVMEWMSGHIDDRYKLYYKHMQPNAAMISIRLNSSRHERDSLKNIRKNTPRQQASSNGGIQLPLSLISSNQIDMAFVGYFAPATVACNGDFDQLMVPFRCVAADMVGRKAVVFRNGDLGKAIRSSMSIPMVFKPVRIDSMLLYDGGIYDNFPWKSLEEEFHPDFFLGSKCTDGSTIPDEENLMDQAFALIMNPTDYNLPEGRSVMIERPFTNDVSMFDFQKADYIIECGYKDAMAAMPQIKERITRRISEQEMAEKRKAFRNRCPQLLFDEYNIDGMKQPQEEYIRDYMKLDRPGRNQQPTIYGFDQLQEEYLKILSDGDIAADYPEVEYKDSTGRFAIDMKLSTKSNYKIMFGGNISSTALNQAYIGFEYKNIGRTANTYFTNVYLSPMHMFMNLGGRIEFSFRRPVFFDFSGNFTFLNYYQNNNGSLTNYRNLTYAKSVDNYATVALGMPLSRKSALTLRMNLGYDIFRYFQIEGFTSDDSFDKTSFPFVAGRLAYERSSLNRLMYPNRGLKQTLSLIGVSGTDRYNPGTSGVYLEMRRSSEKRSWVGARFTREQYFELPAIKWFSLGYLIDAVVSSHPDFSNPFSSNMTAPAFTPTPHSHIVYMNEYRADTFLGVGIIPIIEFSPNFYLRMSGYMFYPEHDSRIPSSERLRYIFDASLVYQSRIGPVSLSLSKYDSRQRSNWFISFNFGFAMFANKGLFY